MLWTILLVGFITWMIWDLVWPTKRVVKKKLGKADEPIIYNFQHLDLPRYTGKVLVFLARWFRKTGLGKILMEVTTRKGGIRLLRNCALEDAPTLYPIPTDAAWCMEGIEQKPIIFNELLKSRSPKSTDSFKFLTIADYNQAYGSGVMTPMEVAENVIRAIGDSDKQDPSLRVVAQFNKEEILKMAAACTQRYANGNTLSFMDGIPVIVKEEYDVVPYHTRSGTTFLGESPATEDAFVVKKLRDAGAIIIGVSNMHEMGMGTTGSNPNRLHGTARNPYNVNHYTGGSSSGSAAAVAAGLCPVALGTDGGGSIRIPAAACGVVGIKASYGRISSTGLFHAAYTVSHAGPICGSVMDAALVYAYIAGRDETDPTTLHQPAVTLQGIEDDSLQGLTLGIDWKYFKDADIEVVEQCEQVIHHLELQGAAVVAIKIPEIQESSVAHVVSIGTEMAAALNEYEHCFHELNPETALSATATGRLSGIDYFQATKQRTRAMKFFRDIFKDEGVDCIITPALAITVPEIPGDALAYGESDLSKVHRLFQYAQLANLTGIPAMTLPVGYDRNGLPVGVQVMSAWWREHVMIRVARVAEAFLTRKKPQVYYNLLGS